MAGSTYFRVARTHTSSKLEQQNQSKVVAAILKLKGFLKSKINLQPRINLGVKKFLAKTIFDRVSLRQPLCTKSRKTLLH